MNPVIEGVLASVCLDIFPLPPVEWRVKIVYCILLCVDRASNWVLARTTFKEGLTGAKVAHLLLDGGWGK